MHVDSSNYLVALLKRCSTTGPSEFAIVDAASATIEDDQVTFIHENQQITGKVLNFGTQGQNFGLKMIKVASLTL